MPSLTSYQRGYDHLTPFQRTIFDECIAKKSGGLSLPMGSGKTLLSLVLALHEASDPNALSLVIVAKNLIPSWELEIRKFFGDTLMYDVLHRSRLGDDYDTWRPKPGTKLIIATPQTVARAYKAYVVNERLISYHEVRHEFPRIVLKYFNNPKAPFLKHNMGTGVLFSRTWHTLIVDEIQQYTNIETQVCQGLVSVYATRRWLMSGTVFNEPKPERVLGYYAILDWPNTPRNLPDTVSYVHGKSLYNICNEHIPKFRGLKRSMVIRTKNAMFTPPPVHRHIVSHTLSEAEEKVYLAMKEILYDVCAKARELRYVDKQAARIFSTYRMAMLTYLLQAIVCPFIPLASAALDMSDYKRKTALANIFMDKIRELKLHQWLDDEDAVRSSRIRAICHELKRYPNERVVMFSCFRTSINMIRHYIPAGREVLTLSPQMGIKKRGQVIEQFGVSPNGILLLTYSLGANGLNLQCANTVFLCDFWWNAGKTDQAEARVLRFGQMADRVNIVYFTSNTALEKVIFEKQQIKKDITTELMEGVQTSKMTRLKIEDIIRLIAAEENNKRIKKLYC